MIFSKFFRCLYIKLYYRLNEKLKHVQKRDATYYLGQVELQHYAGPNEPLHLLAVVLMMMMAL